jgi:inosine/xanthosine triphosphate pyrophosphatase family protein
VTRPLVFATRNKGKLVELRDLLPGVDVLSVDEAAAKLGMLARRPYARSIATTRCSSTKAVKSSAGTARQL